MVEKQAQPVQFSQEAGEVLFARRRRLGKAIEEAAAELNIPLAHLEAMEAGDFSAFSAIVYARGAYTNYARWLGIDAQQAQQMVMRAMSDRSKAVPLNVHTPQSWWQRLASPRFALVAGSTLAAIAVGGYVAWQLRSFWQLPQVDVSEPAVAVTTDDAVIVQGVSEEGVQVRLNGDELLLKEDGSFQERIYLRPGVNVVRVEAENAAGRTRIVEKHLLRSRSGGTLN